MVDFKILLVLFVALPATIYLIIEICRPVSMGETSIKKLVDRISKRNTGVISKSEVKQIRAIDKIMTNPKTAEDYMIKGYAADIDKNPEKAAEYYQKAIQLKSDNYKVIQPKVDDALSQIEIGKAYMSQGKYDKAFQIFDKVFQILPDAAESYIDMGEDFLKLRKFDEAILLYQKSIELKPDNPKAYKKMSTAYALLGKMNKAIELHMKAEELKPMNEEAYLIKGGNLYNQGKYVEAIQSYQKALQLKPDSTDAYLGMGHAYLSHHKYDEAIQSSQKAIQLEPDNSRASKLLEIAKFAKDTHAKTEELRKKNK